MSKFLDEVSIGTCQRFKSITAEEGENNNSNGVAVPLRNIHSLCGIKIKSYPHR
jgi:hypothetical protein